MVFWMIVMAANLVVGAFVGLTGVAGFLLPTCIQVLWEWG